MAMTQVHGNVLSRGILLPLQIIITAASYLAFTPFQWDRNKQRPVVSKSKIQFRFWIVKNCVLTVYYLIVFLRAGRLWLESDNQLMKMLTLLFAVYYFIGFILHCQSVTSYHVWVDQTRKTLDHFQYVEGTCYSSTSKKLKRIVITEYIGVSFVGAVAINGAAMSLHSFLFPESAPGALIPSVDSFMSEFSTTHRFMAKVATGMLQIYMLYDIPIQGILMIISIMHTGIIVMVTFDFLRSRERKQATFSSVNLHTYDAATILVKGLVDLHGTAMLCYQNMSMMLAIFGIYTFVTVGDFSGFITGLPGLNAFCMIAALFHMLANFHRESHRTLQDWRSFELQTNSRLQKSLTARTAIKFTIGGSYFVDKILFLTMCKIVMDGSANLLIMTSGRR